MSDFVDRFFAAERRPDSPERRKEVRVQMEQFVELRFDQEVFGQASTLDISTEGIRVRASRPIETGSCVFMMFNLPCAGGGCLPIQGEYIVLHCDPLDEGWKIGLRAYNLGPEYQANIRDFLSSAQ